MQKQEIINIYETLLRSQYGTEPVVDDDGLLSLLEDIHSDPQEMDEIELELMKIIESSELSVSDKAARICERLKPAYDECRRELAVYDALFNEVTTLADTFFHKKGFEAVSAGYYQKKTEKAISALCFSFCPMLIETGGAMVVPSVVCRYAKIKRGVVRFDTFSYESEYKTHRKITYKKTKKRIPAEEFDIFGDYGFLSSRSFLSDGFSSLYMTVPMFTASADGKEPDPPFEGVTFVNGAQALFEKMLPFFEAGCSILDRQKPNDAYLAELRRRNPQPPLSFRRLLGFLAYLVALCTVGGVLLAAVLAFISKLIDNEPINFKMLAGFAALFAGAELLAFSALTVVLYILRKYRTFY